MHLKENKIATATIPQTSQQKSEDVSLDIYDGMVSTITDELD